MRRKRRKRRRTGKCVNKFSSTNIMYCYHIMPEQGTPHYITTQLQLQAPVSLVNKPLDRVPFPLSHTQTHQLCTSSSSVCVHITDEVIISTKRESTSNSIKCSSSYQETLNRSKKSLLWNNNPQRGLLMMQSSLMGNAFIIWKIRFYGKLRGNKVNL